MSKKAVCVVVDCQKVRFIRGYCSIHYAEYQSAERFRSLSDLHETESLASQMAASSLGCGILLKKGAVNKEWQPRFFVAQPAMTLHYFKTKNENKSQGIIDLSEYRDCQFTIVEPSEQQVETQSNNTENNQEKKSILTLPHLKETTRSGSMGAILGHERTKKMGSRKSSRSRETQYLIELKNPDKPKGRTYTMACKDPVDLEYWRDILNQSSVLEMQEKIRISDHIVEKTKRDATQEITKLSRELNQKKEDYQKLLVKTKEEKANLMALVESLRSIKNKSEPASDETKQEEFMALSQNAFPSVSTCMGPVRWGYLNIEAGKSVQGVKRRWCVLCRSEVNRGGYELRWFKTTTDIEPVRVIRLQTEENIHLIQYKNNIMNLYTLPVNVENKDQEDDSLGISPDAQKKMKLAYKCHAHDLRDAEAWVGAFKLANVKVVLQASSPNAVSGKRLSTDVIGDRVIILEDSQIKSITISIENHVMHDKVVTYTILIKTKKGQWTIKKRFNDFLALHNELLELRKKMSRGRAMLPLPVLPKKKFRLTKLTEKELAQRQQDLHKYIQSLCQSAPVFSESDYLRKFLAGTI